MPLPIAPGSHVLVRDAVWRVLKVEPTSNRRRAIHCVGVDEIVRDQPAVFVDEYERDGEPRVLDPADTQLVVDTSSGHRGALLYMESLLRQVPPDGDALVVGHQAAMDALDYQLEPAQLALRHPRARILIADAVGLGKTLEAGILLSELIRRGQARRILVVTLKSMLAQFQHELWVRFSVPLVRLDRTGLDRIRERIPSGHNPFHVFDRAILSIDTLKQHNAFRTHLEQSRWDVVILDEAHNVARRGAGSQRRRLAELLAERTDHLILLSATPHDGRAESFASLMNLLDPTAIANPKDYGPDDIRGLYVRRHKADVAEELGEAFPERVVREVHVPASAAEEAAFEVLASLRFTRIDQRAHGGLLFRTTLEKALFSSPAACLQTLRHRIAALERREDAAAFADDLASLRRLHDAVAAIGLHDFSRYRRLVEVLRSGEDGLGFSGRSRDDRLVIFTERIETMKLLARHLPADLGLPPEAVATLSGETPDTEMATIVEQFGTRSSPLRLLIASDVAAEGINLHYQCHRLVHFDVPWSLMVFQQRNGRVDRYGQKRPPVLAYLLTDSAHPRIRGDQRILQVLVEKDAQASRNLGDAATLMGRYDVAEEELVTARAMEQGLDADAFAQEALTSDKGLLELLLAQAAPPRAAARREAAPSLFPSAYDYLLAAVDLLREDEPFEVVRREADRFVELQMPPDLARRMKRVLPDEAMPADHRLVLTADAARMQALAAAARGEDDPWPHVHFLWPLHPVLDWVDDRVRHRFGRMTAPVMGSRRLPAGRAVLVVSALLPNRRGQPLMHRWYAVHHEGDRFLELEPFHAFARRVGLGPCANLGVPTPVAALQARVPGAVLKAREQALRDRAAFEARINERLQEELDRLDALRRRRHAQLELDLAGRADDVRARERHRVDALFDGFLRWVEDAMTTERDPVLQVVAAVVGGAA